MRVCVFCGSSPGRTPAYQDAAREVGKTLAERGIELVYGGASVGTMGVVADAALAGGGVVHGVIPQSLVDREVAHSGLTTLKVVANLHERKAGMSELSDAYLVLPGGAGTLEELFEVWTWAQLGLHTKPIALLDVAGFYQPMLGFSIGSRPRASFATIFARCSSSPRTSRRHSIGSPITSHPRRNGHDLTASDQEPRSVTPPFGVS